MDNQDKLETRLVQGGRPEKALEATVNHPVHRASTVIYPDLGTYLGRNEDGRRYSNITYGATGTHNARALAAAVADLEGGHGTVVTSTGLSAITMTLAALLSSGDHVLVSDSVYAPTRNFCANVLARYGVTTTYYDPGVGAGIADLMRPETRLVFTEAPGSLSFEMQDIPAIVAAVHARGALVAMDNTWATPLYFRPIDHGVDVSIQAGTKYVAGHSDLVIGLITSATQEVHRRIFDTTRTYGDVASPDDCFLALRGLRTMSVRLARQAESAMTVATWLNERPQVRRVLFPALPSDPGHALWKRDFSGASSLFGVVMERGDLDSVTRFVDALRLFCIGSSWGGYESLVAAYPTPLARDVVPFDEVPFLVRLHVGLEDPEDLIADLEQALAKAG